MSQQSRPTMSKQLGNLLRMRQLQLAWSPRTVFPEDGGEFQSQNSFLCGLFWLILNPIFASPEEGPLLNRMRLIFNLISTYNKRNILPQSTLFL